MKPADDWKRFEHTGKIQDYLQYKEHMKCCSDDKENSETYRGTETDAGFYQCYRDDIKTDTCR